MFQALAGEKACYNTIVGYGNQILILGMKTVHLLTIRPWIERLNYLVKQVSYFFYYYFMSGEWLI